MHIKLIQPGMHMRPMDTHLKNRMSPPLGLYTIASMFRNSHRVTVENENVRRLNLDDAPDIVGISVNVDSLPRALEISDAYRSRGIPVVIGGIMPTLAAEMVPQDRVDAICIGAAEGTWPDIIRDFTSGCLKKVYRCSGPLNGKDIVPPAYDLMPKSEYLYTNIFHASRGCPPEELYNGYLWIYDNIYSFRNIIRRIPRARRQIPSYLMFNFFYRKWGRFTDRLCSLVTYRRIGLWGEKLSKYL